jgi:hypothetical protein
MPTSSTGEGALFLSHPPTLTLDKHHHHQYEQAASIETDVDYRFQGAMKVERVMKSEREKGKEVMPVKVEAKRDEEVRVEIVENKNKVKLTQK